MHICFKYNEFEGIAYSNAQKLNYIINQSIHKTTRMRVRDQLQIR